MLDPYHINWKMRANIPLINLVSKSVYHQIDGIAPIFQIWSMPVGYEELAEGFEPIRNGVDILNE